MTDEEIRETRLKVLEKDLASINNRLHHAFNQGFELGRKSITPKEKTGHWIEGGFDFNYWICSKCKYQPNNDYYKPSYKYCPNCGARMEVENGTDR